MAPVGPISTGACPPESDRVIPARGVAPEMARYQTWNELPQPQVLTTLGLLKTKPRFSSPS